jgi:glyoxylase-like metal-dependent hydrolase (beta-lactamase superfamily II)
VKGEEGYFNGCSVDRLVHDGDRLDFGRMTLYAIWTPGHTPGSTCYYLYHKDKHILFSEDIALHNGRHAWMRHPYADWEKYLKSLKKLAGYTLNGAPVPYDILLPGHGVVELEGAMRSVKETVRVVTEIVQRRRSGEDISGLEPFRWNWEQGVKYKKE